MGARPPSRTPGFELAKLAVGKVGKFGYEGEYLSESEFAKLVSCG